MCSLADAYQGQGIRFCNSFQGQLLIITEVVNYTPQTINLYLSTCTSAQEDRVNTAVATLELQPIVTPPVLLLSVGKGDTVTPYKPFPGAAGSNVKLSSESSSSSSPWMFANDAIGVTFGDVPATASASSCNFAATFVPAQLANGAVLSNGAVDMVVQYTSPAAQPCTASDTSSCFEVLIDSVPYPGPYLFMSLEFRAPPVFLFANAPGQMQSAYARLRTSGSSVISWLDALGSGKWLESKDTTQLFYAGGLPNMAATDAVTKDANMGLVEIHFQSENSVVVITLETLTSATLNSSGTISWADPLDAQNSLRTYSTTITLSCAELLAAVATMTTAPNTWFAPSSSNPSFGLLMVAPVIDNDKKAGQIDLVGTTCYWLYFRCPTAVPTMSAFASDVCFHPGFESCNAIGAVTPPSCLGYFNADTGPGTIGSIGLTCRGICSRTNTFDAAARQTCQRLTRKLCDAPGATAAPECACQRLEDSTVAVNMGGNPTTWQAFKQWFSSVFDTPSNDVGILTQPECWWPACAETENGALPSTTIGACPKTLSTCLASISDIDIQDSKCATICVSTNCSVKPRPSVSGTLYGASGCTNNGCGSGGGTGPPSLGRARALVRVTDVFRATTPRERAALRGVALPGCLSRELLPAAIAMAVLFVLAVVAALIIGAARRK